jgi:DNA-binding CsgD family transcriptional regulator
MDRGSNGPHERRLLMDAERHTPSLLHNFLRDLEDTENTLEVWTLLIALGTEMGTPYIDFICASSFLNWRKTQFIRTSYDSTWLNKVNKNPEVSKWSYFRSHAMLHLTPIVVGSEYLDEYRTLPKARIDVVKMAADLGLRAGFSVPLRLYAPPQAGLVTFIGDHSRAEFDKIVQEHGWTMNTAALVAHQKYMTHFVAEFFERNEITEKQRVLLELIGLGLQDKQIAFDLGVSVSAVRQRMTHLLEKTGLQNRADLAALAMSLGVVPNPLNRPGATEAEIKIDMGPWPEMPAENVVPLNEKKPS